MQGSAEPDGFELKKITKDGVLAALQMAEHYRLLQQPAQARSICLDVLEVEPGNQRALVTLILALTDQFGRRAATAREARIRVLNSARSLCRWMLPCADSVTTAPTTPLSTSGSLRAIPDSTLQQRARGAPSATTAMLRLTIWTIRWAS